LPDVAGRRRAVSVAIFVGAVVVSLIPTAATSATAPPGINRFLYALGQVESGGNYYARNSSSGAYGKYQIMPSNWPTWARIYIGSSTAPQTPTNQEKVARGKVTALYNWLDTWPNVAHWWLTGSGERNQAYWSSYSKYYVAKVMKLYNAVSDTTAAADVMAAPPPMPVGAAVITTRKIQDTNVGIVYVGRWAAATHSGYSDGRVLYSSTDGAKATFSFTGRSIAWIGPVGSTRGKARIYLDGVAIGTVDLRRADFRPQVTLFKRSWTSTGDHKITIQVIGSGRPVAIDEFVITR
jgi:transglycosylase-like protein with SLT domain